LAASMRRSTSRSVRYSRLRLPTVTFTEVGAASASQRWGSSAGGLLRRYQSPQDDVKVFQISSTEEAKEDGVLH
jgi:hypothetical protein